MNLEFCKCFLSCWQFLSEFFLVFMRKTIKSHCPGDMSYLWRAEFLDIYSCDELENLTEYKENVAFIVWTKI